MMITSRQNPKVKSLVKLRNRKPRDEEKQFIIEGYREILRAVEAGWQLNELYFCAELFLGVNEEALIDRIEYAEMYSVDKPVFEKMSYRDRPDGLIAVAPQKHLTLADLTVTEGSCFVIAESIEKPGNLGSILRSCDATACAGLIVCDRCTDIFNPNVVRASVGTLFSVPIVEASTEEVLAWIAENKVGLVATTPAADKNYTEANLTGPIAIAVGTEQIGLTETWISRANVRVKIPMCGIADSLNVASATTLLLYEQLRQR
jgi:RNA methyltransferase, TrmH family